MNDYDEFDKLEKTKRRNKDTLLCKRKYAAKDFLINLLNERPYLRKEIEEIAIDADLTFGSFVLVEDIKYEVKDELSNLIENGIVEMRYDDKGRILYGLCKDSRKK